MTKRVLMEKKLKISHEYLLHLSTILNYFYLCHCLHLYTISHPDPKTETWETFLILLFPVY